VRQLLLNSDFYMAKICCNAESPDDIFITQRDMATGGGV